jgi:rubrerythrin
MEFGSVDEIISFATDREKEAVEFYTTLSKKVTIAALRETFERFAQEEEKHVELLTDMGANKEKIESYEFAKIPDLKISDYLVEEEYKEGMLMPDILKLAMKKEETAVKLYSMMADQADKEDVKKVFNILVQEESKHKFALESMYDDYLSTQDS